MPVATGPARVLPSAELIFQYCRVLYMPTQRLPSVPMHIERPRPLFGPTRAAQAMRSVTRTRTDIELVWLPVLARILDSTALTRRWWYPLADSSLEHSLITVMADGYGWSVQADPLTDDSTKVTAAEARALGAMMNMADLAACI